MDILLFGGTGAMGSFLVDILSKQGNKVYVTSRRKRDAKENVSYLVGNAHDNAFFEEVLKSRKWDCVVDFMNYSTAEFANRCNTLLENTKQLVYLSSSRVYAEAKVLTEDSDRLLDVSSDKKYLKTDDYALAKARQEDILHKSGKKNYTIIRPYMTYFKNRLDLGFYPKELWLYRALKGRSIVFPKNVATHATTLSYGHDVAEGIAALVGKQEALGETFHITQNGHNTWNEILNVYKQALKEVGVDLKIKFIEKDNCISYINEYDRCYDRLFDNSKINHYIDTFKFIHAPQGIAKCVEDFMKKPSFRGMDWRMQGHWDRLLHERTPLSEIQGSKNRIVYILFRYIVSFPFLKRIKNIIK